MKNSYETIENIKLIENNLTHLNFELNRNETSYFRIAREAHQVFYRTMVEALRGSANLSITGIPKDKKRVAKYKISSSPFMEIQKESIKGCKKAWRYSKPVPCDEPKKEIKRTEIPQIENYLKSFYDVLAMIQTECFMTRYIISKPIIITDEEMKDLEWLHEKIRNEYEHFIPKSYSAPIIDLLHVSKICIEKTEKLIFKSGNLFSIDIPKSLIKLLENIKLNFEQLNSDSNEKT